MHQLRSDVSAQTVVQVKRPDYVVPQSLLAVLLSAKCDNSNFLYARGKWKNIFLFIKNTFSPKARKNLVLPRSAREVLFAPRSNSNEFIHIPAGYSRVRRRKLLDHEYSRPEPDACDLEEEQRLPAISQ